LRPLSQLLESFLTYVEVERGLSRNTVAAYAIDGENLLRSLPEDVVADPASLVEKHVFDFLVSERRRGRSVSSVRRSLSAVRTFLRFLVREGVLRANPAANLDNPKTWKYLPSVLEVPEIERLVRAVEEHPSRFPRRDRAIVELIYATGLRVSEAMNLKPNAIHRDLGVLRCLGKGSRERVVPISRTALAAIEAYEREERPRLAQRGRSDLLFLSRGGKALGREVVRALLLKYARIAGIPGRISPHTLRHSLATHLIRGGADLRIVQEILGHAKVETTEIYTHIERSELKAAHRKYHPRG
jgi:integrase/recombinase XerD